MNMPLYSKADAVCGNCAHFYRHYVRFGSRCLPLDFGHCVCLRAKDRRDSGGCPARTSRKPR